MYKIIFFFLLVFFPSCAVLDYPKRIAGYSTEKFENEKNGRFEKKFALSKKESFDKTFEILKSFKARITQKNFKKGLIVAFDFSKTFDYCLDSTEAAFFFEEKDEANVLITVVSNNSLLAKIMSDRFFELLENDITEENGQGMQQETMPF